MSVPTVPVLYMSSTPLLKRDNVPGIKGPSDSDSYNFVRMSYKTVEWNCKCSLMVNAHLGTAYAEQIF